MNDKTDSYDVTAEADQAHDDQWLADAIVALGVGGDTNNRTGDGKEYYEMRRFEHGVWTFDYMLETSEFVRDWRVAGACLERWPTTINTEHLDMTLDEMLRDPHAICEAWVEALS